jgi:osmotically-inducible protein OsmY
MISEQIPKSYAQKTVRCDERVLIPEHGKELDPVEKKDAGLKTDIANAFWKDDVLRALEYHEIDVRVQNGVVHLNGHIVGTGSQNRINNALRTVAGIVEIKNHLILDEKLTLEAAAALGDLEHTYGCKFFTGTSHGVVSINGTVKDKNVRLLAEKCVSENPNTRGVINNVQVLGNEQMVQDQPFLQPAIGQTIYFLDWAFGVMDQVIINPNNRRVIAMIVRGKFTSQQPDPNSEMDANTFPVERSIIVPMSTVRHLTRTSGFLYINSSQRNRYMDLYLVHFITPPQSWVPPYPYCPDDVLFPVEYKDMNMQIEYNPDQYSFAKLSKDTPLGKQLLANDSLGG